MANAQQSQPAVAIPLPNGKRMMVQIGCICMMLSVAMYGLVFATLTTPILSSVGGEAYVAIFTLFGAMGVSIMTPIGGKLGDLIGRRNIVVIPGIICLVSGIGIAFIHALVPVMALRLLLALAQGAFTAAPYIIVSLINERKDVPKAMGLLAAAIAVGGFGGSIIAGILTDMGMLTLAILMPAIPLVLGVVFIGLNLPNQRRPGKITLDIPGIVALVVALCGILIPLNLGSGMGWTNPLILGGFVIGIIGLVGLVMVEKKAADPLIPLKLFANSHYTVLLIVGFICYFYQGAMNVYAPMAVQQVMKGSTAVSGALQMPRTIITMILPAMAGAWVGKKTSNSWKAMVLGTLLAGAPMAVMGFTTPGTPVIIYFVAIAITGVAEAFRSVSITPAAQAALDPENVGIGTSLVNFANSLSSTVAAAIYGLAYNSFTAADPTNVANIQSGINMVFMVAAGVSLVGLLLVIFVIRPQMMRRASA